MSAQLASASRVPAPECVVMNVLGMRTVLGVAKSQANRGSVRREGRHRRPRL